MRDITVGRDDESREVVGYWGVCRGRVDGVDGCHREQRLWGVSGRGFGRVVTGVSHITGLVAPSIASIYSIRFINTDMKNFKKSLVFSPFPPNHLLISFYSFVPKTQILQKINPLNSPRRNPQHPPLLHYPLCPPRLVKLPSKIAPDTTEAIILLPPNYLRNLLALPFKPHPPRTVD